MFTADDSLKPVSHGGGYWFITASRYVGGATVNATDIFYATDPTGSWGSVTLTTGTSTFEANVQVEYDGTRWGTLTQWQTSALGYKTTKFAYASTLSSWNTVDIVTDTATVAYLPQSLGYSGGTWVASGVRIESSTYKAWLAYSTAPTTSWTVLDDPTAGGLNDGYRLNYAAGLWVWIGRTGTHAGGTVGIYTSSNLTSWTPASSVPSMVVFPSSSFSRVKSLNGYAASVVEVPYGLNGILSASTPSGTWTLTAGTAAGVDASDIPTDITHDGTSWLLAVTRATATKASVMSLTAGSPIGTYTETGVTITGGGVTDGIDSDGTHSAVAIYYGDLYSPTISNVWASTYTAPAPRYQAIGGNLRLRQRQTPIITG